MKWKESELWSQARLYRNHNHWMVFASHLTSLALSSSHLQKSSGDSPKVFLRAADIWGRRI